MMPPAANILRALLGEDPLPTPQCAACQAQIAAFVDAELAGEDAAARFPDAAGHMSGCETCRQAHRELVELLALDAAGRLVAPPATSFDFGYLPVPRSLPEPLASRPWRLDDLGRLIIQFSSDLLQALQPPALQPGYLKDGRPAPLELAVTGQVDDLEVRIGAEPAPSHPDQYDVEVEVDVPSRGGWPHLSGIKVALRRGDGEVMAAGETDAFGKIVFDHIPADDLRVLRFEIDKSS